MLSENTKQKFERFETCQWRNIHCNLENIFQARHVLEALKKYFDVERKEHTHTLQHYYMAVHDDINSEDISTYKDMLLAVEVTVNIYKYIFQLLYLPNNEYR